MSRSIALLVLVVLSSFALAAQAQDDLARQGPYLGLAGVLALEDFEGLPPGAEPDNSGGLTARGGFRFHPHLAAEMQFEWIPEFDLGPGDVQTGLFTVNGKALLATGRFQPYAVVGLGGIYADIDEPSGGSEDDSGFAARLGAGAEVYITREVVAYAEGGYVFASGDADEYDYGSIQLGLMYRF